MTQQMKQLAKELNRPLGKVTAAVELLDAGNTIPFIARYRKEATGEMDEVVLRQLSERLQYLRNLEQRKEDVLKNIAEQGKLTEELETKIRQAEILQEVEDLYLPYKQKRRTRASIAREKGLEPLALAVLEGHISGDVSAEAALYIGKEDGAASVEEAIQGAMDIIAEILADDAELRKTARQLAWKDGRIVTKLKKVLEDDETTPYEMYYAYEEAVKNIPPHRILAMNRGENEEVLAVKVEQPEELILAGIHQQYQQKRSAECQQIFEEAARDGWKRLIGPAIEREIRNELTDAGEVQAIKVFSENLHNLLLQAPVKGHTVLGVDPGFRTGCKLAVVDDTGKVLEVGVMYPHPPQKKYQEAMALMKDMIVRWNVSIIAIGNGTASRESEALAADVIRQCPGVQYIIVSEAGASVYSASPIAKEEFPEYDLSLRSAVSIARRLQDPLAELVKIEPKAVGVGQYQHDVTPKKLDEALHAVVEDCVNGVGVELNTASSALLQYVAGLSRATADGIVKMRNEQGKLTSRKQLLKVPRLGPKAYEQCAGFIRIADGENPLDNTPVHPESYQTAEALLQRLGYSKNDLRTDKLSRLRDALQQVSVKDMAKELEIGEPTLKDIIAALQKPGRDPREELDPPLLRSDVLSMEDLKPGMELKGTVRNVVDFGAFVDIGVKQDGLIHISQFGAKFIKHPMEVVAVGDIITVRVLDVDLRRGRIALTMRKDDVQADSAQNKKQMNKKTGDKRK
ncbi:MAG: RNA-binding transcriptional accessory protein [Peptococcaceae bacterium]|nr:RNA-binding transcriptional accessory protein [Peptococcaceae bacterium]MBQ2837387.1 RNA-binding transcriptional accessory protein [Peptococcaceae bacterium]MBQ2860223.1 RNA-binding transcriptional accessory protein [Peptococcaceae bacterium]MBQ2905469.1 RNA-binding transcriptional accessory protein [Peptococcaceae bacterium]MBQ7026694.1 RNA-binding transcriptional accessory protein [Peptococcaceae bacterium]